MTPAEAVHVLQRYRRLGARCPLYWPALHTIGALADAEQEPTLMRRLEASWRPRQELMRLERRAWDSLWCLEQRQGEPWLTAAMAELLQRLLAHLGHEDPLRADERHGSAEAVAYMVTLIQGRLHADHHRRRL